MLSVHSLTIVLNSGHKRLCFGVEICANRSRSGSLNADTRARLKCPLEILASSISSTCFRISASGGSIAATLNSVSFSLLLRLLLSSAQTPLDRELLPLVHSIAGKLTCETWRRDQKIDKTVIDVKTVSANARTRNDITQLKVSGGEGGSSSLALPPNPMCKNAVAAALLLIPYKRLSATIAPGFLVQSSIGTCCDSLSQSLSLCAATSSSSENQLADVPGLRQSPSASRLQDSLGLQAAPPAHQVFPPLKVLFSPIDKKVCLSVQQLHLLPILYRCCLSVPLLDDSELQDNKSL